MSLKIYFLRHGQSTHSKLELFCGSRTDALLTAEGSEMAERFADAYASMKWEAIYASPQSRAVATIDPFCKKIGKEPLLRNELKEIDYGIWDGLSGEEVRTQYPQDYSRWLENPVVYPPSGGGETAEHIQDRALKVIDEIQKTCPSGNVLVASHKTTIRVIICTLMGIDLRRYRYRIGCPVCSVSVVEFQQNGGPLLQVLGERNHLDDRLRNLEGS